MYENQVTEFKREYVDEIRKTVIAFANSEGGTLYLGVDDNGVAVGIADIDGTMLKLTNAIRDSIRPDVTMFINYETIRMDGVEVIKVSIGSGTAKPYYLAGKGIRPEGVFVRQGASSVPATETAILHMIRETSGYSYEKERSLVQNLTFYKAKAVFTKEDLPFSRTQYRTLGIIGSDEMYTNLGLLLSEQCQHTIKLAVFEGTQKLVFKDRYEATGSLLEQLESAFDFIDKYNRTRSEFPGLYRKDIRDYPLEALREALLNAIIHRDYAFSGSVLISIFDDRIEFVNVGGLIKGLTYDDIMLGVSASRNQNLAAIFYRMHLIEAYGTGLLKIKNAYNECYAKAKIEVSDNAFKITLPNRNYGKEQQKIVHETQEVYGLNPTERAIINLFETQERITRSDVENVIGLSLSGAIKCLKSLQEKNYISKIRQGRNIFYMCK